MKYIGGCHCGEIRFEVDMQVEKVMSCNCSICSKRGYLLTFAQEKDFTLLKGESSLSEYQFGKKRIHHYFCKNCGTAPFGKGKKPDGSFSRAINVRCLDEFDLNQFSIMEFDGKSL